MEDLFLLMVCLYFITGYKICYSHVKLKIYNCDKVSSYVISILYHWFSFHNIHSISNNVFVYIFIYYYCNWFSCGALGRLDDLYKSLRRKRKPVPGKVLRWWYGRSGMRQDNQSMWKSTLWKLFKYDFIYIY